ncbi:MAG: hypothetical protein RR073_04150 [Clostridia bacterium]
MQKTKRSRMIAVVAMLVVAVTALTTASYAWFTMQKEVSATGLTLTATAPTNLLISKSTDFTGANNTVVLDKVALKMVPVSGTGYTIANPLAPASLWYADTNKKDGVITGFTETTFKPVTAAKDKVRQYYIDVDLYIKAGAALDANSKIDLFVNDLTITENTTALSNAFRVGVVGKDFIYAKDLVADSWKPLATDTTLAAADKTTIAKADTTTKLVGSITDFATPQKVTLRIWLEGQDSNCIDANNLGSVTLGISFGGLDVVTAP